MRVPVRPVTRPVPVHATGDATGTAPVATPSPGPVLVPVRVSSSIDGVGSGAGPSGAPAGGVPGKDSSEPYQAFVRDVRAKFSEAYRPLFREKGSSLAGVKGAGKVKLFVSPSGVVRFDGWKTRPAETLFEDIVKEAVAAMPPVLPPPDGESLVVMFEVSGVVTE